MPKILPNLGLSLSIFLLTLWSIELSARECYIFFNDSTGHSNHKEVIQGASLKPTLKEWLFQKYRDVWVSKESENPMITLALRQHSVFEDFINELGEYPGDLNEKMYQDWLDEYNRSE